MKYACVFSHACLLLCLATSLGPAQTPTAPTHPFPGNEPADIWLLAGQSNMAGWGMVKAPITTDSRIMEFRNGEWRVAVNPAHQTYVTQIPGVELSVRDNIRLQRVGMDLPPGQSVDQFMDETEAAGRKLGGVGPGLFFAKELIKTTGRPIGLTSWAWGGGAIKRWMPSADHPTTQTHVQQIIRAIGPIKGVIWYQGETDALSSDTAEVYNPALLGIIDSLRHDSGDPNLPFIVVQVGRYAMRTNEVQKRSWEKVREAQRLATVQRKHVYLVSALDLLTDDVVHVSQEGQQRLGKRLAEIAASMVYGVEGHGKPIELHSTEILKPNTEHPIIRVRFSGVTGRLQAAGRPTGFELRQAPGSDEQRMIYRVDFDPTDPSAVLVGVWRPFKGERDQLVYGPGADPYVNIVDEKDMPLPAFGPIDLFRAAAEGARAEAH